MDFNPGVPTFNLISQGAKDFFILKLSANGNFVWAKSMGSTSNDVGNCIAIDGVNNIYSGGGFQGPIDFDPDGGIQNLSSLGGYDIFIHKMSQDTCSSLSMPTLNISITAGTNPSCVNSSITLNATASNVVSPIYQWKVDGNLVGTNSPTFQSNTFTNGQLVTCTIISNTCYISNQITSNSITIMRNPLPIVTAGNVTGCNGSSVNLVGNPMGGIFSVPNPYNGPSTSYTYTYSNSNGCTATSSPAFISVDTCISYLNLKLYIQGYYLGGGLMAPVLLNQGVLLNNQICDIVIVELHSSTFPYSTMATTTAFVFTNGNVQSSFNISYGNYYIAVKHRNSLETWSSVPVYFGNSITTYDFTTAISKAYGNNMKSVGQNKWAFISGDTNFDRAIDSDDYLLLDPAIVNGFSGYLDVDLNGDGSADALDAIILIPNVEAGLTSILP